MYKLLIRPILFLFPPEFIHNFAFQFLRFVFRIPFASSIIKLFYDFEHQSLETELCGIKFRNPVGLAAGFDKDAKLINELACFGFGFIEIGTLTPKPQIGNPKPRLFRLKKDRALINRMGFNNEGVLEALVRLKFRDPGIVIGGNIGRNNDTPNDKAFRDYEYCFEALFDVVDYFVVNVSSPNTPELRELQHKEPLRQLLSRMRDRSRSKQDPKPIFLKIAPDLNTSQLDDIVEIILETKINGIIATNTTTKREGLKTSDSRVKEIGQGGLSGIPIGNMSDEVIKYLKKKLPSDVSIIGVGGIFSAEDAVDKLNSGAKLIQIYTGFIYEGPALIKRINKAILKLKRNDT